MSDVTIPGGKIRAFVERIENIETEIGELNEQKKEVFAEAKNDGFDVKILREIIKLRKQDQEERDEREGLLELYMRDGAIGHGEDQEGGVENSAA